MAHGPDDGFVVVWNSYGQDGYGYSVNGQRFDSSGATAGTEFQVNTYTTSFQTSPAAAFSPDGSFVVVWSSFLQDGDAYGVVGQRFDSGGAVSGTEFQVNSYTTGSQFYSQSIVDNGAGDFVVVWFSSDQDDGDAVCDLCLLVPNPGCSEIPGLKNSLQIKDKDGTAKAQVKWKITKVNSFAQADLGDPAATTDYALCIYDETAGMPTLAGALRIDSNGNWDNKDPKGSKYKDKAGS